MTTHGENLSSLNTCLDSLVTGNFWGGWLFIDIKLPFNENKTACWLFKEKRPIELALKKLSNKH